MTFACKGLPSLVLYPKVIGNIVVLLRNCHGYMVLSFAMSLNFLIVSAAESGMAAKMPCHLCLKSGLLVLLEKEQKKIEKSLHSQDLVF